MGDHDLIVISIKLTTYALEVPVSFSQCTLNIMKVRPGCFSADVSAVKEYQ
jgi:hypothetical protein